MKSILLDSEHAKLNQIVQSLFHHALDDYIARANRRDVLDKLYEFFDKADVAIISKAQLKVYQELEKLTIDRSLMKSNAPIMKE